MSEYEERIKASPAAKRLAEELNIDITKVVGTGADGRIQLSDIENYKPVEILKAADELTEDDFSDITLTVDNLSIEEDNDDFFELRAFDNNAVNGEIKEDSAIFAFDSMGESKEEAEKPSEFDFSDVDADAQPDTITFTKAEPVKPSSDTFSRPARKSIFDVLSEDEDDEAEEIILPQREAVEKIKLQEELPEEGFSIPFVHIDEEEELKEVTAPVTEEPVANVVNVANVAEEKEDTVEVGEEEMNEQAHFHIHDDDEDEYFCEECHKKDCECEDDDEDEFDEDIQPLDISFTVKAENIEDSLDKAGLSVKTDLIQTVIKSIAYAIYDTDSNYDGKVNVVSIDREGINVYTAADSLDAPVGKIKMDDPSKHDDDIFVNVWDLTSFGFNSYRRPDAGMMNIFVTQRGDKVKIEMIIDEYAVDLYTATIIAEDFRLNLNRPSLIMNKSVK